MKTKSIFLGIIAVTVFITAFVGDKEKFKTIELGVEAPLTDVKMMDVSGSEMSLADIKKENGLCVIFSCNTCPFVVGSEGSTGWEGRYNLIAKDCERYKIGMVLVNSNEDRREGDDSFEAMKTRAAEQGYQCKYVMDKGSELANAFGAKTTPHVFLFDSDMKLVYRGSIDDNVKDADMVDESFLLAAIDNLISGDDIDPADTKALGCSIKRVVN